jgi:hypothetical protein
MIFAHARGVSGAFGAPRTRQQRAAAPRWRVRAKPAEQQGFRGTLDVSPKLMRATPARIAAL